MRMSRAILALATAIVASLPIAALAVPTAGTGGYASRRGTNPDSVLDGKTSEIIPAAQGDALIWSQNTSRHPRHFNMFLKEDGSPKRRINRSGTEAFPGGISGDEILYQVVHRGSSDIRMVDLPSRDPIPMPSGVNTGKWEWSPTITEDYFLFGRDTSNHSAVVLFDRSTGNDKVIADGRQFLKPGQIAGDVAAWQRCSRRRCDVFRYDVLTEERTLIPAPSGTHQYAPSVGSDGTVYFVRSGNGCGTRLKFVAYPPGGPSTVLTNLPDDREISSTYVDSSGVDPRIYYDRVNCRTGGWDIWRFDPN
jgi:hypothetical protein